jgi:SAM-dependent methyltransferase
MFQVLEHLYDPSVYVQAAAQLLHPAGRLIVQVPNAGAWQFVLFGEHWSGLDMPRHLMLFHYRDLENLLNFCGFEIVRRKRFSLLDDPTMLATSLVPELNPRQAPAFWPVLAARPAHCGHRIALPRRRILDR